MALWFQDMYLQVRYSSEGSLLLIREQGLDSCERLRVLTHNNFVEICNFFRMTGDENANRTPNRGQQVSLIAKENLKLAVILFHYWWRCIFNCEVTGGCKDTVCMLAGQKKLKDECKDLDVLPKVNKADGEGQWRQT